MINGWFKGDGHGVGLSIISKYDIYLYKCFQNYEVHCKETHLKWLTLNQSYDT